jgi:dipeptidyl aminopeptidase/acylaminoacyl peptidase
MRRAIVLLAPVLLAFVTPPVRTVAAQEAARRPLRATDIYQLREVRDPQLSPDGAWVAYTVTIADSARNRNDTDVWMSSWDGQTHLRLTSSPESESTPRWSPDGRWLAFLSGREDGKGSQVWLLDRRGGEAVRLTKLKSGIGDYAWSPDAKTLLLEMSDPDPDDAAGDSAKKKPKPIVIDSYRFKRDRAGYLDSTRTHLYLFDVATGRLDTLTRGRFDEESAKWSPDGRRIAFMSKREGDIERNERWHVYVMDARAGATPSQVTTKPAGGSGGGFEWSPDGRSISYYRTTMPAYSIYDQTMLAVVDVGEGADGSAAQTRDIGTKIDRDIRSPRWMSDGRTLLALVEDDRRQYVARVDAMTGEVERVTDGDRVVQSLSLGGEGRVATLVTTPLLPAEVFALEGGELRRISHQNDAWLAGVQLGVTEGLEARAKDGSEVHAVVTKPAGLAAGARAPALIRIHGGPTSQDAYAFHFERELFAANGYVVASPNYRGSSGRGQAYMKAIDADWGNKEVVDVQAVADALVARGLADAGRMGIGGWSYGGITTNYTIATTQRFKAAISGAGSSLQTSMYGTDQYTLQYDTELGAPWKNRDRWLKVSYPFFQADRITTPTLFMVGEKDFNVPAAGSEQMYQALRSIGVPTELVIYPGQYHGLTIPSFRVDRLQRYVAWYDRWLKPGGRGPTTDGMR